MVAEQKRLSGAIKSGEEKICWIYKECSHIPLANVTERSRILNVLPDEEFFSRESDVQKLFNAGLDVARSLQPSCFLTGNRKSGKTEILKRVYNRLFWEQDTVIPFFHSLPKYLNSAEAFCREYFFRSILQFVGFLRKDPLLVMADDFHFNRIIQLAYESKYSWLVEAVDNFQAYSHSKDLQVTSELAIHFPATASMKSGFRGFVILDDFHHIASLLTQEEMSLLAENFLSALQSRQAPHLFSGSFKTVLKCLFKTAELPGNVDVFSLRPLQSTDAQVLFEGLCQRFDVPLEPDLSLYMVLQLDNNPFYLRTMVQAARRELLDFRTLRKFVDLYTHELTEGNLHLYFDSLIHSTSLNPVERIKALELLHLCTRKSPDFSAFRYFKNRENLEGYDFEKILSALDQITLIDYGLGVVTSIQDTVLKDWIEWNFTHKISGIPMQQASYEITSELLKRFNRSIQLRRYADKMEQICQLLLKMDCQTVSVTLFDYALFSAEQGIRESMKPGLAQQAELTLPEIISVTSVGMASPGRADFTDQILVGKGFASGSYSDEAEIAWLVGYNPAPEPLGLEEVQRFYQKSQLVIQRDNLKSARLWLLAENRFNQAALSFAHKHQIHTSNSAQFDRLCQLVMKRAPLPEEEVQPENLITYDMAIPLASDAELVAVRALEQIAENIEFDDKSKGQIRMALIEACINAKEVSGHAERIHLKFQTAPDRLITHLYFEPFPTKDALAHKEASKGWSLKMLQTLMDDVRLSHTHRGLELTMTKYLRNVKREAV